jgi:lysophospholipase L1-like esterase
MAAVKPSARRARERLALAMRCLLAVLAAWLPLSALGAGAARPVAANADRYRADNVQLGPPAENESRIVFFGDSITEAWPQAMPAFFAGRPYVGRGIGGETTGQMLERFDQDVIALAPKVVVILAGTNDIAENAGPYDASETRAHLRAMTERAQARRIGVVLASLLPARDYPWRRGLDPAPKIIALNAWIKACAAEAGAVYLDYFNAMRAAENGLRADLSDDGVHPNPAGYRVMAPLAEDAIRTARAKVIADPPRAGQACSSKPCNEIRDGNAPPIVVDLNNPT